MKKNRKVMVILCSCIVIIMIVYVKRPVNPFLDIKVDDIDNIVIWINDNGISTNNREEIQMVYDVFDSMSVRRKINLPKDGGMVVEVQMKNHEIVYCTLDGGEIRIFGRVYKTNKDYYSIFINLAEKLED